VAARPPAATSREACAACAAGGVWSQRSRRRHWCSPRATAGTAACSFAGCWPTCTMAPASPDASHPSGCIMTIFR